MCPLRRRVYHTEEEVLDATAATDRLGVVVVVDMVPAEEASTVVTVLGLAVSATMVLPLLLLPSSVVCLVALVAVLMALLDNTPVLPCHLSSRHCSEVVPVAPVVLTDVMVLHPHLPSRDYSEAAPDLVAAQAAQAVPDIMVTTARHHPPPRAPPARAHHSTSSPG